MPEGSAGQIRVYGALTLILSRDRLDVRSAFTKAYYAVKGGSFAPLRIASLRQTLDTRSSFRLRQRLSPYAVLANDPALIEERPTITADS